MSHLDFNLYLVTDRHQINSQTLTAVIEEALKAGVKAIQLREKDLPIRSLLDLAYELRKLTRAYDARLLINDRVDLCLAVEADGVHLRADGLPVDRVRSLLGPEKLVAVSTHSVQEAYQAQKRGADFIVLGPIYYTPSKASYGPPVGPAILQTARRAGVTVPIFAIGGITPQRVQEILSAGADGVAVISAILAAQDVRQATQDFTRELAAAKSSGPHS
jgi:thiamine-phosphate pyrophosphorylase